jgi:hypothetical protein
MQQQLLTMKHLLILTCFLALIPASDLHCQSVSEEAQFLSMIVPTHYVRKNNVDGVEIFESTQNRSLLSRSKDYKSIEDGFLSARSAADFTFKILSANTENLDVKVIAEKIGALRYSVVSWALVGDRQLNRNHIRAYNDDGQFIHCFEMSSNSCTKKKLEKSFRSFLRTCKPVK